MGIFWDCTGDKTVTAYFKDSHRLCELDSICVQINLNRLVREEALKGMRSQFIDSCRKGSSIGYSLGKDKFDMVDEWNNADFQTEKFFDFKFWRNPKNNSMYTRKKE